MDATEKSHLIVGLCFGLLIGAFCAMLTFNWGKDAMKTAAVELGHGQYTADKYGNAKFDWSIHCPK